MNRRLLGIPVWAWAATVAVGLVAGYLIRRRSSGSSTAILAPQTLPYGSTGIPNGAGGGPPEMSPADGLPPELVASLIESTQGALVGALGGLTQPNYSYSYVSTQEAGGSIFNAPVTVAGPIAGVGAVAAPSSSGSTRNQPTTRRPPPAPVQAAPVFPSGSAGPAYGQLVPPRAGYSGNPYGGGL